MKRMRKRAKKRLFRRILLSFILIVFLCIGATLSYYFLSLRPVGKGENSVVFEIKDGQSYDEVLANLESKHLIRSTRVTKLYSKLSHSGMYYAGNFSLNDGMSTSEVLSYISNIDNAKKEQVVITVPEGKWAKEIAALIHENYPQYSEKEILKKWNDSDYIKELAKDYEFLDAKALNNKNYRVKLEGYLFPETYSFNSTATIDEITRTMLSQFDTVYQKYKTQFDKSEYSVHELISLASVVQFESGQSDDMKKIAGVFYNRLDEGMRLESSVTVCYALYDDFDDPQDCEVQTDIKSPYNTYLNSGIPIGPILNPGQEAIEAVLNPDKNDYLYFLADINGDGKVYYSKTYEEHQEKMEELGLVIE